MFSEIARTISNHPNGVKVWRDHANKVFSEFHGNTLGPRKADAFAAKILNIKNANTLYGLEGVSTGRFESLETSVEALCTRHHDNAYGEGYYDFFQPVLNVKGVDGVNGSPAGDIDQLGIFTIVYFDHTSGCIEVTQRLKVLLDAGDGYGQYEDAVLSEDRFNPCVRVNGRNLSVVSGGLSKEGRAYLDSSRSGMVQQHLMELDMMMSQGKLLNDVLYFALLRCVQTMELDRLVDVFGESPRMTFLDVGSIHALYQGSIQL